MTLIKPYFKNPDEYTDIEDLKDYVKHLIEIYNSLIDEYNKLNENNEKVNKKLWVIERDMGKIIDSLKDNE